jgi:NADH:ubiquinone oxidoreductase subunit 3 (subunit A)
MPENIRSYIVLAVIALVLAAAILILPFIQPLIMRPKQIQPGSQYPSQGGMVAPSHQQARASTGGAFLIPSIPTLQVR